MLVAVALLLGGTVYAFLGLRPPDSMTLAAGPEDGGYYRVAEKYRDILARDGIRVDILTTEGSLDNIDRLASGAADAAILQGGIEARDLPIEAIATIFYEPVVFLMRDTADIPENPALWRGLTINRGQDGSGTYAAFESFRQAVDLPLEANTYTQHGYTDAVHALEEGRLDLAIFVAPFDAPYLLEAYHSPHVDFLQLEYVEAISRRWPYANVAYVPDGAVSLDPVVPDQTRAVLALKTLLTMRSDLHPALVNRLTMAALELHSARGIMNDQGEFPSIVESTFPMNGSARQLIVNGPTIWQEKLPFWIAAQVNRVFVLLLPLLFLLIPLLRALPAAYAYAMNYRVWQHYPAMRAIENELDSEASAEMLDDMAQRLTTLDQQLGQLRLPAPYRQAAYHARLHVDLLQKRIKAEQSHKAQNAQNP